MAAMAGALGVELEKAGHYRLGDGLGAPRVADIGKAVRIMMGAALVSVALVILLIAPLQPALGRRWPWALNHGPS